MSTYHLAQINVARPLAPLDSPLLADFVANLARINELAERSPGFVWRLQSDAGDATAFTVLDDVTIPNLTVWESLETLHAFVYRSAHVEIMRRRREWFEKSVEAITALWWVPAGHRPDLTEAADRLLRLRRRGPTTAAFTFAKPYPAPDAGDSGIPASLGDECPA